MFESIDKKNPTLVHEEMEEGTEVGCNPSPWFPCGSVGSGNYTKTYTIHRKFYHNGALESDKCAGNKMW